MKGISRSAKPQQQKSDSLQASAAESGKASLGFGLTVVLAGLLVAALLVWLGLPPPSQQEYRSQLAQYLGAGQAASLHQAVSQLTADTGAAAANPRLLKAVQSQDKAQLQEAQTSLRGWDKLVDARINGRGQAEQDSDPTMPITFAALDLIRRAESGQDAPPEALKVGNRWLVYSVAPIRNAADQTVAGTLLLSFDLQRLTHALAPLPADAGEISLQQKFTDGPGQTLYQSGTPGHLPAMTLDAGNPHWSLVFTPGTAFQASIPWVSIGMMVLAALAVLATAAAAIVLTASRIHREVAADAEQLTQLIQELSGGKAVKAFSLRLRQLNGVAASLARLSLRPNASAATESSHRTARSTQGPARFGPTNEMGLDPLLRNADILDVDILDEDGLVEQPGRAAAPLVAPPLPDSIFRAYDIRGVVGTTLHPETAYWVGRAIGAQTLAQGEPNVSVGRDGRLSGPQLVEHLVQGLYDAGCHVSDVGLVPTPALYYAASVLAGRTGVMLTGSHNPPEYNGFKVVIAGDTLANEQILQLHERLKNNNLTSGKGSITKVDILDRYFKEITGDIVLARRMKVVVDCGNGAAAVIAPQLIEALNCEVIPLFCEVDGHFPNHHPDPGKPENLLDLIAMVRETGADIGLAFDGDGDRVGVVTNKGTIVYPDRLLMLFAKDVIARNPGADVIFDVKCTRRLTPLINGYGGRPVMWKTGHSLIKKHMKLTGALLAGEMSGHIFFKERWFGFDDGIYSAARLLEILSQEKLSADDLFATFPNDISTPEINVQATDESKFSIIQALERNARWGEAQLTTIDGLRVDYPTGWGLVRASNTTPALVLRFEADTDFELRRIQQVFHQQLKAVAPDLQLPF